MALSLLSAPLRVEKTKVQGTVSQVYLCITGRCFLSQIAKLCPVQGNSYSSRCPDAAFIWFQCSLQEDWGWVGLSSCQLASPAQATAGRAEAGSAGRSVAAGGWIPHAGVSHPLGRCWPKEMWQSLTALAERVTNMRRVWVWPPNISQVFVTWGGQ